MKNIQHKINDLRNLEGQIGENLEYSNGKISNGEIEERVKSGMEEHIN